MIHQPLTDGIGEADRFGYDQEQLLLIGDWYHRTAEEVQASYLTFRSSGHEVRGFEIAGTHGVLTISKASSRFASYKWAGKI